MHWMMRYVIAKLQNGKLWLMVALLLALTGCASTPDMTPLPTPDITSSAEIDDSVRRPTPVYEFPEAQTSDESQEGENGSQRMDPLDRPPTYSNESTSTSRTVLALLDQASKQEQMGSPEKAAATLERSSRRPSGR